LAVEFVNWTIKTIREDPLIGSWLEEKKFDWIPLITKAIIDIIEHGKSVLIVTDDEYEWFEKYILTNINKKDLSRPFLPIYSFNSFVSSIDGIKTEKDIELIYNMLDISFPNGYFFWYIGKGQHSRSLVAKLSDQSLIWVMDEQLPNSFELFSDDPALPIRLLNMYRLFDKTLEAVLFAQIDIEK
jgi:hypothetical protein